jgi:hypothetical protein
MIKSNRWLTDLRLQALRIKKDVRHLLAGIPRGNYPW